jgi:hypothetical protein
VDSEKATDSLHRKALWFKITDKGISQNMVNCIKQCIKTKFCARYGEYEASICAPQIRGIERGCGLSFYLFNIPELLNTDDFVTAPFRSQDYAILPVHIVWTENKLNHLFDYMVHILGFGGKALSDLQVYVMFSADAVPCCRRSSCLRCTCRTLFHPGRD